VITIAAIVSVRPNDADYSKSHPSMKAPDTFLSFMSRRSTALAQVVWSLYVQETAQNNAREGHRLSACTSEWVGKSGPATESSILSSGVNSKQCRALTTWSQMASFGLTTSREGCRKRAGRFLNPVRLITSGE